MATAKSLNLAKKLQEKLALRIGSTVQSLAFGTAGDPLIAIHDGTPLAGEKVAYIRIVSEALSPSRDVLGNASIQFTPHIVQLALEQDAASTGLGDIWTAAEQVAILGECLALGCKLELYQEANTTVPAETTFAAAKLKTTFYPDLWNPLTSQQ